MDPCAKPRQNYVWPINAIVLINNRRTFPMVMMSDNRRRRIIAKQRKLKNSTKRAVKAAKRERKSAE
jgi:hypothetical protein